MLSHIPTHTVESRAGGDQRGRKKGKKKKKRKKQRKDSCHSPAPWHPWSSVQGLSTEVPSTTCTMLGWPPLGWRGQEARQGPVNPRGYFSWVRPPPLDIPIHREQNHPCAREADPRGQRDPCPHPDTSCLNLSSSFSSSSSPRPWPPQPLSSPPSAPCTSTEAAAAGSCPSHAASAPWRRTQRSCSL